MTDIRKEIKMADQSYDQREGFIWLDGKFVPWQEATTHVLTHALHYASSVFEGERSYMGNIFELELHTARLIKSGQILGFEIPWTAEQINNACNLVLEKQGLLNAPHAYIRPVAWRGSEMMGVSAQKNTIHLAIAAWEWPSYFDKEALEKGLRLNIAKFRRPDPKTAPYDSKAAGLYMICTLSKHEAESQGYNDSLMLDWRGQVAEATGANVFFIKDGKLFTPIPDCFLDGITRRTVIALAKTRGIEVIEKVIMPEDMSEYEECFLTGTAAEVSPVSEIGPYKFQVGDITKQLIDDYQIAVHPNK